MLARSAVRHPKFSATIDKLELRHDRIREVIDGAIWEISKDPEGLGRRIEELDMWQVRLEYPQLLLTYSINRRFIFMLVIEEWK